MSTFDDLRKELAAVAKEQEVACLKKDMKRTALCGGWQIHVERTLYEHLPQDFKDAFPATEQDHCGVTISWRPKSPSTSQLNSRTEQS